jgi:drug/metabolite transporter (DMT)-like permease
VQISGQLLEMKRLILTKGVQYMLISTACFTVMQSLIKYMPADHIPTIEQTFFRSFVTWVFCVFYMLYRKITFKTNNIKLIALRSVIGSASMFSFFYILPRMPLGSSVALKYLSPIFTAMFAVVLLKEKLKPVQWLFFLISFIGVVLLKGFDTRIALFDFSLGIFSAITGGILYILIRKIGDDDHPSVVVHYFMLFASILSAILMIPYWVTPTLEDNFIFFGVGFSGFIAQIYMTKAFQQKDDANYLAIFKYLEAIYAIIIGYLYFGETYSYLSFFGIILIFLGLILMVRLKSMEKSDVPI